MDWKATAFQGVIAGGVLPWLVQWSQARRQAKQERAARFRDEKRAAYVALLLVATHVERLHRKILRQQKETADLRTQIVAVERATLDLLPLDDPAREPLQEALEAVDSASTPEERDQRVMALVELRKLPADTEEAILREASEVTATA